MKKWPETYYPDTDLVRVVIETPYRSRNKYAYDPDSGLFVLTKVLPDGFTFPFNMGFIPNTKGEDGDPLDAIVLMKEVLYPGTLLNCHLLGVMRAEQKEKGKKAVRNDRFIFVVHEMAPFKKAKKLSDLGKRKLEAISIFFREYNSFEQKSFSVLDIKKANKAHEMIRKQLT